MNSGLKQKVDALKRVFYDRGNFKLHIMIHDESSARFELSSASCTKSYDYQETMSNLRQFIAREMHVDSDRIWFDPSVDATRSDLFVFLDPHAEFKNIRFAIVHSNIEDALEAYHASFHEEDGMSM